MRRRTEAAAARPGFPIAPTGFRRDARRTMDSLLLDLLCCPETRQPLRTATAEELGRLAVPAALVREDGRAAYPIRDGIPLLVIEEQLPLNGPE